MAGPLVGVITNALPAHLESMGSLEAVARAIEAHPMALPSDRLEVLLDRYQTFGVGQCQCRMAMKVLGQGCGKPLSNCTVMAWVRLTSATNGSRIFDFGNDTSTYMFLTPNSGSRT